MRTKITLAGLLLVFVQTSMASDAHGSSMFHAFTLQADYGDGQDNTIGRWDLDGWVGSDDHKLWIKIEGNNVDGSTERAEVWALYSRNIATFWDAQMGIRFDAQPQSTSYLTFGFNGLAPYFFETEAHLFVSDKGDVSARLREKNEFLVNQKLILQPYLEANLFAQDVPELNKGSGLSSGEIGLQMRYEVTRKFVPYMDIRYERLFGGTASMAEKSGERKSDVMGAIGLRLMF